ncbi:M6 family metalloprotease domain-containing protein [bacterium]|nr:M6 family metalloprotease domain-containing protein [bacterium]
MATSSAKPGIIPSEKVLEYTNIMAVDYVQGGLVDKIQRIKAANIQNAANGNRDLREDVYMSFPVILGSYANYADLDTVVDMLQHELFDGPWPTITMAEHYAEMSYGQFHLSGTVYGWYELDTNSAFYEGSQVDPYDNGFYGPPGGTADFLREALDQSDPDIDFSLYDNDGPDGLPNSGDDDGFVDAAFFVHSGPGGEGGGPFIWSHRWTYSGQWGDPYTTNDMGADGSAIRVNDYIMQPAVSTEGGLIEIGVFSHEFGHALGLPDLYDTDYSSGGLGDWCLMASGSWATPTSPVHMSAWCKEMLGWTVPIIPDENLEGFEFPNAEENSYAVKLWTHGELDPYVSGYSHGQDVGQEYFLLENRQILGSEQSLPGPGILIWHVDNSQWSNSDENHRLVDMKPADGAFNGSSPGDAWPGITDNRNFDFATIPTSIGWAGVNTEIAVLNISDSDTTMSADIEVFEVNPQLALTDVIIEDGNEDHIYAPGESLLIWITVFNTGAEANNLTATLSTEGTLVDITEALVDFDPVNFLETGSANLPFELEIDESLPSQAREFDIAFISAEMTEAVHHTIRLMLGYPQVAIIDDDGVVSGEGDYQSYYTRTLDLTDLVYTVWDIADYGLPGIEWLQAIPTLIWYTGDSETAMDDIKIPLITNYLEGGGNTLMTGQDISSGPTIVRDFLAEYFAVEVSIDDVNTTRVYGDTDHEIMTAADHYTIFNTDGAYNQDSPDGYDILEGGLSLFEYPLWGHTTCGSSVRTETYSTIMLGFGLEALGGFSGGSDPLRADVIYRMVTWLDPDLVGVRDQPLTLPGTSRISSVFPNPFNPEIKFEILLSANEAAEVQITDIRGAVVDHISVSRSGLVTWKPAVNQAAGLYFVRLLIDGVAVGSWEKITYLK